MGEGVLKVESKTRGGMGNRGNNNFSGKGNGSNGRDNNHGSMGTSCHQYWGTENKRKVENKMGNNNTSTYVCVVNRIGGKIILPSGSPQRYCSHSTDVDKVYTFHERCKLSRASFPWAFFKEDTPRC